MYYRTVKKAEFNNRETYIEVGKCGVISIRYHEPRGGRERHYIDVRFESGKEKRIFDICELEFM